MHPHLQIATDSVILVSFYKPLLLFATFVPWAWLISSRLEKDARRLKLKYQQFNILYMTCALGALVTWLAVPIFWIGWPLGTAVLLAPVYAYVQVRNRAVPEKARFRLSKQLAGKLASAKPVRGVRTALRFVDTAGNEHVSPRKDDPRQVFHMGLEDVIMPALEARAAKLDFSVGPKGSALTQTIDGVRYKRDAPPADSALPIIDYLKEIAGLKVEDRRRRQTASMRVHGPMGETELTVVTAGSSNGMEVRLVFDRTKQVLKPIDGLGLLPVQLEAIQTVIPEHDRHGIFLFGAPAGHGLTTTGYSLIGRHDAYTSNVKTLEREIMARREGVDQLEYDSSNPDVDFATNLQSIIRRDPDIVLISELTEAETARTAAEPGKDGPLMYIPQRLSAVNDQIRHWAKLVGDLKTAVKSLRVVMNQRLVRQVCPNCRQPFEPSAEQLRKMNVPAGKVKELYQANGKVQVKNKIETCPVCGGTGYFAQIGVFQVLIVTDTIRRLLLGGDLKGALAEGRRDKMMYLQEAAVRKVVDGETTIDEVARVTASPSNSKGTPRPTPNPAAAT